MCSVLWILAYIQIHQHIKHRIALTGVAQQIGHHPTDQKFTSLIPSQGTCLSSRPGPLMAAYKRQSSLPSTFSPYSSCPWVILIRSLASTFPILFLPSPCLFSTYHLCYLFSVPLPSLSPSLSPVDNPSCDLHFCCSIPVLVVCLVFFCFCFRCGS